MFDTLGEINESAEAAADPILPTTNLFANPTIDLPTPCADNTLFAIFELAQANVPAIDPTNHASNVGPGTDIPLADPPIPMTTYDEPRVEASKTSTTKEGYDPSSG